MPVKLTIMSDVQKTIVSEMEQIAQEQEKQLAPLSDDLMLVNSGFDSLCFAVLVARLEDKFGLDPFTRSTETMLPLTVGDLVRMYENAAATA
jgi:acyl carrier protein